ncbi:urea amidolyase associated protein UAAP2 [Coraliomargarita akajimensis]|uniref:Urea carboxylase-associated protein 1 n=1 Tax=Coraliomargarita akajimensis (strain DSM 45221 / IAM 15411 / JCM 23193 / KCTC 12865 / 04OKA010-24) TaxID=583355 RepID=D5ELF2_CORAD|nr:urea amidolyase associated protein UAAP2 [Coraliomargarita akajimensis]ADE55088.1 urea carboxylase-associated protein 1 [Coraliomargarita akajimensis DSM 45221]
MLTKSTRSPETASYREVILAGDYWIHEIKKGQTFRILDMEGNQAADTLFYDAQDMENRYSASDTVQRQGGLYLTTGSELISTDGDVLLKIVADTCGRHDTLGGACSRESNTMRYAHDKEHMHACRDSFIRGLQEWGADLGARDITCNINFFMNVPVTPEGELTFADGISGPGRYVEMVAERDVVCLISNCPQLNNPCNAYNPTPVEVIIWDEQ